MKKSISKKINWKILIASLIIVYAVAFLGSLFTDTSEWYESVKPSITPPNLVFPIVWNILFFLIAISIYFSYTNADKSIKTKVILFYGINLALNLLWSIIFFGMKMPKLAFIDIILIWISIFCLIIFNWKISKIASYLLIPYLLWVSFAIILNFLIAF